MSKWIAEFDLEDGDTMPEHMDLEYKGAKLDFHCRPKESILDKIRAEIEKLRPNLRPEQMTDYDYAMVNVVNDIVAIIDKYKAESDET